MRGPSFKCLSFEHLISCLLTNLLVGQALLTASADATVRLWATKDGSCLRTFSGHGGAVLQAHFLSLGTQLSTCGSDGLLKLWSVATGEEVSSAEAHDDKVWTLDIAAGAECALLTGGADGGIALWADCTASDRDREAAATEAELLQQQVRSLELSDSSTSKWVVPWQSRLRTGCDGHLKVGGELCRSWTTR